MGRCCMKIISLLDKLIKYYNNLSNIYEASLSIYRKIKNIIDNLSESRKEDLDEKANSYIESKGGEMEAIIYVLYIEYIINNEEYQILIEGYHKEQRGELNKCNYQNNSNNGFCILY